MSHSGKRDKGKHEAQKKAAHTPKEKRQLKREKKHQLQHPEDAVGKLAEQARPPIRPVSHG
jgi:hypothetical protein